MSSFKAHFDGLAIVLDEPAELVAGQALRVVVETPGKPSQSGLAPSSFSPLAHSLAPLTDREDWDESTVLNIDPIEALPKDFVRQAGSASGQIGISGDFKSLLDEFEEYR